MGEKNETELSDNKDLLIDETFISRYEKIVLEEKKKFIYLRDIISRMDLGGSKKIHLYECDK